MRTFGQVVGALLFLAFSLVPIAVAVWLLYLLYKIAEHVEAWPF